MLLIIMITLINLSIPLLTSSAPAVSAYIVVNLPKLVIFDDRLQNGVFIAASTAAIGNRELDTIYYYK